MNQINKLYLGKLVGQIDGRLTKIEFPSENMNALINNIGKVLFENNIAFGREFGLFSNGIALYLDETKGDLVENFLIAFN